MGVLVFVCTECGNERDASHFVTSMMDMECGVSLFMEFNCDMYMYLIKWSLPLLYSIPFASPSSLSFSLSI